MSSRAERNSNPNKNRGRHFRTDSNGRNTKAVNNTADNLADPREDHNNTNNTPDPSTHTIVSENSGGSGNSSRSQTSNKPKKPRRKGRPLFVLVLLLILILLAVSISYVWYLFTEVRTKAAYAAGSANTVPVYTLIDASTGQPPEHLATTWPGVIIDKLIGNDVTMIPAEAGTVIRGAEVGRYSRTFESDGNTYYKIEIAGSQILSNWNTDINANDAPDKTEAGSSQTAESQSAGYYILADNLADSPDTCVTESEVYVRTPATIYKDAEGPAIASYAPKGTRLKVTGFDKLLENGYVNKYRVVYGESDNNTGSDAAAEGYVYGKYVTDTEKKAKANYNEHGEYDAAKKDIFRFELYGGSAKDLDYYPYGKTKIEGNEFLEDARAMYINTEAAINTAPYVKLIKETDCNAVVIDIKDGPLTYKSPVAKEWSPNSYKKAYASMDDFRKGVQAYRDTGVYLIGRIVVFNDTRYAKDHPEDCIKYNGKSSWPSAFSRDVWEYNVRLAQEAVKEFGFNEIQFDYVRFPESSFEMSKSGKAKFRNTYDEEKAQAIQNFCFYAADQLREVGAYISVDVFGESAYGYVTAYGQYWNGIANIVDSISAMPYTDHFSADKAWEKPYDSVLTWAKYAAKQQKRLQNPAAARTWITGYDTPYWKPAIDADSKYLSSQIKALKKAGLTGGFIPWNVLSSTAKYREYKSIWNQ